MRNTWWVTRPKRSLVAVQLCLSVVASHDRNWKDDPAETGLAIEEALEVAGLKRIGERRDQTGGGARTYRAWLKSLGLVFMRDGALHLTLAGEELVKGAAPVPILTKQVLSYQFPSAFTWKGGSAVDPRFQVRPYIFLLQLLRDPRLGGYLHEFEDIAKIAVCYGESNSTDCVQDVADRILDHRSRGDVSLDHDYLEEFGSTRSQEPTRDKLFGNLRDIANTMGNWLGYTQLIARDDGKWTIVSGAEPEIDALIQAALATPLIKDEDHEEKFQRRYGLTPGKKKDTRSLTDAKSIMPSNLEEAQVESTFLALSVTRIIDRISPEVVRTIADQTGVPAARVDKYLSKKYPSGAINGFMNSYTQMAFESQKKATDFERATASVFEDVFGYKTEHIGTRGRRPDVVLSSESGQYGAILDSKAYKDGYSIGIGQQNRMRDYIEDFPKYALANSDLAFFAYVVADYKGTIDGQIKEMAITNGVPGSAVTARDIIRLVTRHQESPYTHDELREIFSVNRAVTLLDIRDTASRVFGE
jgi:hypothetical protein